MAAKKTKGAATARNAPLRILVTGGAGFIGSHVVDLLIAQGHSVSILDNFSTGRQQNVNPNAHVYHLDIQDPLDAVFNAERPDVVYHLAAQIDVRKSVEDPVFDARVNILGAINLLETCVRHNVRKFIFSSSGGAIYGDTAKIPTPEGELEQPASPYGIAKLAIEKYLHYYHLTKGLNYCALRYANVYGPRQNPLGEAGVVAIFIHKLMAGDIPTINGDGKQTRDYVYVEDVARANLLALEHDLEGSFNVGTGIKTGVNEIAKHIATSLGISAKIPHGPGKEGEQRVSCISAKKLSKATGWKPSRTIAMGISDTVAWFKEHE